MCLCFFLFANMAFGQNASLQLSNYELPSDVMTTETPLLLTVQLIDESAIANSISNHFLIEKKKTIEDLHQKGELSDSIFQIYKSEWDSISFLDLPNKEPISSLRWEVKDENQKWIELSLNTIELLNEKNSSDPYASNMIILFIHPEQYHSIHNKTIRAISNNDQISNEFNFDTIPYDENASPKSIEHLSYIADCWFLAENYTNADSYSDQILAVEKNSMFAHYLKGASNYHLNNYDTSLFHLENAIRIFEESEDISEFPEFLFEYLELTQEAMAKND